MFYLLSISLIGVSFSVFPFYKFDNMWFAQALWMQIWVMLLFSYSFIEKPKNVHILNKPLAYLHMWIVCSTAFFAYKSLATGKMNVAFLLPYFNFLCGVMLYHIISRYLDRDGVERMLKYLKYVITFTLLTCVLQYFGISQFFTLLEKDHPWFNNLVSGYLANGTHLSGFVASCIPLYLYKLKREDWLNLILIALVLSLLSTTKHDPAISGYIVAICVVFYFYKNNPTVMGVLGFLTLTSFIIVAPRVPKHFFSYNGRIELQSIYLDLFRQVPITGAGLGAVNRIAPLTHMPKGHHLHMELFQFTFELGLVGLALIVNLIKEFFSKKAEDKLELTLKTMFFGFLVSSCFTYPAHLWLPASFAIFSYGALYAIKEQNGTLT